MIDTAELIEICSAAANPYQGIPETVKLIIGLFLFGLLIFQISMLIHVIRS